MKRVPDCSFLLLSLLFPDLLCEESSSFLERNLETGMSHVMSSEVTLQSSPVSLSVSKLSINLTLIKSLSVYVGVYIIER